MTEAKGRTFVFISNIPDFLVEPADPPAARVDEAHRKASGDLRYKRLRDLLVDHSNGVMRVLHMQKRGYGLALYASEKDALAACQATIIPEAGGTGHGDGGKGGGEPLLLRIVERERAPPPEAVYCPVITVEKEEVLKADLAETRGLEQAYRGLTVPRWCERTLEELDCPLGTSCFRIHRRACQRTVRKRPKLEDRDETWADELTRAETATLERLAGCSSEVHARVLSPGLHVPHTAFVTVSPAEVSALLNGGDADTIASVAERAKAAAVAAGLEAPFFAKFSFPGGAPWDSAVTGGAGAAALRERCRLPANGAPTPLEWDLYCQRVLYHQNELNRCATVEDALRLFHGSRRVKESFEAFLSLSTRRRRLNDAGNTPAAAASASAVGSGDDIQLCIQPWLSIPTAQSEVTVFLESGGERLRGAVQRRGEARVMVSSASAAASFASTGGGPADVYALLDDYSALQDGAPLPAAGRDGEREADRLIRELRVSERLLRAAMEECCRFLQQRTAAAPDAENEEEAAAKDTTLPKAYWCVNLALPHHSGNEEGQRAVVALSVHPYERALQCTPLYYSIAKQPSLPFSARRKWSVVWNVLRHQHVLLFDRSTIQELLNA